MICRLLFTDLQTANGIVQRHMLMVENATSRPPYARLFFETAVQTDYVLGNNVRLSGWQMRRHLYFGTSPGNNHLYVAEKENGLVRQFPTV